MFLHYSVLHCTTLYYIVILRCGELYYIISYCATLLITLYYVILYCVMLRCINYTTLYYIKQMHFLMARLSYPSDTRDVRSNMIATGTDAFILGSSRLLQDAKL